MVDVIFTIVAESVFSYALEHSGLADKVRDWLGRHPAKLAFQKALASAFTAFTRHYPEHAESFFDRTFLADRAAPILAQLLTRSGRPDPTALLNAWHASLTPLPLPAVRRGEMLQASSDFLRWLEAELMQADALQALFDSRALDALNQRVESLTEELRRVLAVTTALAQSQPVGTPAEPGDRAAAMGRDRIIQRNFATGDFARLQDLYIPPDDVYERVQVQDFVGRDWLKARVEAFLDDPKRTSGVLIIEGEAGVGKTAFLARLVFERGYLHVFAGQERARGNVNVASAILSLEAQLVTRYRLVEYLDRDAISDRHANPTSLGIFMRKAAAQCAAGERIVIVCDALDEAGVYPQGNVLGLPEVLPDGIFLILSRRPSPPVRLHFADLTPVVERLQAASAENQKDLGAYLRAVAQRPVILDQLQAHGYTREQFVRAIQSRSGGVWMYVHYVVDEVLRGERIPLDLDRLPLGLIGFYAEYWERYRADVATWYDISLPLLTTLAAVQTPLSFQRWVAWAGVSGNQSRLRRDVDDRWRAFISRDGDAYQIYHASLRDFLTGNVERLGETSGLIAEMAEATRAAHGRIVVDLHRQCSGDWPRLVSDDYARRYLCEHLVGAGEIATLWKITTESNVWAEARNRIEDNYAGFLGDLRRAWDAAESETDWDLARQIRCALINSSIAALANNLTPELALALVETQTWSLSKVLAHISCMTDDPRRSDSLAALGPVLVEPWWGEAIRIANAISDRGLRTRTLITLAPRLPERWRIEALSDLIPAQPAVEQDWQQAELLATLAPILPADLHGAAVAAAGGLYHNLSRFAALTALAPTLDEAPKARALAQSLEEAALIGIPARRVQALVELAPHVTPEQRHHALTEALETIGREALPAIRADLLVRYGAELVSEQPQGVLDLILAIPESSQRLRVLAVLLPTFSKSDQILALGAAIPLDEDEASCQGIVALSAVLPSNLWTVALERAIAIRVPEARARALTSLSLVLTDPDRQSAIAEALASIAQVSDDDLKAAQLRALVPLLKEPQRAAAWTLAGSLRQPAQRALILGELAAGTEGGQRSIRLKDALTAAHDIIDPAGRLGVLSIWAAALAPQEQDPAQAAALKALKAIEQLDVRATAALDLAEWLSPSRCRDLAEELLSLPAEVDAAPRLTGLLPHLAIEDRGLVAEAAVAAVCRLPDSLARVEGVIGLAPWLVGDHRQTILEATLQEASNHPDATVRADLLLALAPLLSEPQRAAALAVASAIEDPGLRAKTLVRLAPHLTATTQTVAYTRALAAPQELPRLSARIQALFDIARNGTGEAARQALGQALLSAREIGDGVPVVDLLVATWGHLPPQGQAAARECAV
ncbi:MAG: ATP-binding protein, partial [Anaerolineales bacterium]|nr:ATP-binding protein [Anaerolineales bacterium]